MYKLSKVIPCKTTLKLLGKMTGPRQFHVVLRGTESKPRKIKNGVPQGDGFSPIAFVVYLAYECADLDCEVFVYADDINIVIRAPTAETLLLKWLQNHLERRGPQFQ